MTPPITPPAAPMSAADEAAHEKASYTRRPVQESPKPPTDPAARRRFIAQRGW
ncbi:hypothetical protein [Streptomyces microflavus]|uniref:hypothetical protein n=1 Tax=Streptomyces microflavus TaxID=1919 RepID=UPI002E36D212|nr:hypothetical protein [Streptomyces microflavus]